VRRQGEKKRSGSHRRNKGKEGPQKDQKKADKKGRKRKRKGTQDCPQARGKIKQKIASRKKKP